MEYPKEPLTPPKNWSEVTGLIFLIIHKNSPIIAFLVVVLFTGFAVYWALSSQYKMLYEQSAHITQKFTENLSGQIDNLKEIQEFSERIREENHKQQIELEKYKQQKQHELEQFKLVYMDLCKSISFLFEDRKFKDLLDSNITDEDKRIYEDIQAISEIFDPIENTPKWPEKMLLVWAYSNFFRWRIENYDPESDQYESLLKKNIAIESAYPLNHLIHGLHGLVCMRVRNYPEAIQHYQSAIDIDSTNSRSHLNNFAWCIFKKSKNTLDKIDNPNIAQITIKELEKANLCAEEAIYEATCEWYDKSTLQDYRTKSRYDLILSYFDTAINVKEQLEKVFRISGEKMQANKWEKKLEESNNALEKFKKENSCSGFDLSP